MSREGLRPCIEARDPAFAAQLAVIDATKPGVPQQVFILKAVCEHYGFTYDGSMNPVTFAGELEDQIKAMP